MSSAKAFSSRSNQESPVPGVVSGGGAVATNNNNSNSALPPPPPPPALQQQQPSSLSGVAAAFQPPFPRSQQNQQSPSPTQGQGAVPSYHQNHQQQQQQQHHHHHHNNNNNNTSSMNTRSGMNTSPSMGNNGGNMNNNQNRGGFSGNYNNNQQQQGSSLQQYQQSGGSHGHGHQHHHQHHHNSNNNNNRQRSKDNNNNNGEEPTGTTGVPTDLAANIEVYAHGEDKIFTIPREDIISLPPLVAGGSEEPQDGAAGSGGTSNTIAGAPGQQQQQQQQPKLQLCPTFDPENPDESCPLGARCRFVHARTNNAPIHDIHCNYAYNNPEDCKYECYPAGELLRIAPPNSNAATDDVPSNYVLKTRALQSSRRVISHCAHYYFNRVCNRGSECFFIHAISLVPKENGTHEENMYRRVWGRTQHRNNNNNNNRNNGGTSTPPPVPISGGGFSRNDSSHGNLYNDNSNSAMGLHGYPSSYATAHHLTGTPPRGNSPNEQGHNMQFPSSNSNSNLAGSLNGTGGGGGNFNATNSNTTPTPPSGHNNNPANSNLPTSLSTAALQNASAPPSYFSSNNNNNNNNNNAGGGMGTPSKMNGTNNLGNFGQQQQGVSGPALSGRNTPPPPLAVSPMTGSGAASGGGGGGGGSRSPGRAGMNKSPSMSNMAHAFANHNPAASSPDTPGRNEYRRMNDPYSNTTNVRYVRSPVSHQPTNGDEYEE